MSLDRFIEAQASTLTGYETARRELRAGQKKSHWIWYIFPQLAGLGRSTTAQYYALQDPAEAIDYLRQPTLRARFLEMLNLISDQLSKGIPLTKLMAGETDCLKLVSSVTLFRQVAAMLNGCEASPEYDSIARSCADVLRAAERQGYSPCEFTLSQVRSLKKS